MNSTCKNATWTRFLPLLFILLCMAFVYLTGVYKFVSFDILKKHYFELQDFVQNNPLTTPLIFIGIYAISIILLLPGRSFLSLLGGFLFQEPFNALYLLLGAMLGAISFFLTTRVALKNTPNLKETPWLSKTRAQFQKHPASYMLFSRLMPFFPFWLASLLPAFFQARLRTYLWTTFVGMMPVAFAATQASRGLGAIFESQGELNFNLLFHPQITVALSSLSLLALAPIFLKKWTP